MTDWATVKAEHRANVGFREGPNNQNLWGPEQGVGDHQPYCDSAASMVPHHHGLDWWADCTFYAKGCAYTVSHVEIARRHGRYVEDHASKGQPAPLKEGMLAFFDWNGSGTVDHVETIGGLPDGPLGATFQDFGYNTGDPGGCYLVLRDRRYLHGVIDMDEFYAVTPEPVPTPPHPAPDPSEEDDTMKLRQPQGGSDNGKVFLVGPVTYRYISDDKRLADLVTEFGPVTAINAVAWGDLKGSIDGLTTSVAAAVEANMAGSNGALQALNAEEAQRHRETRDVTVSIANKVGAPIPPGTP